MPGKQGMEQTRDGNVIEDWDVSRLIVGQAIVGLPGLVAVRLQIRQVRSVNGQATDERTTRTSPRPAGR